MGDTQYHIRIRKGCSIVQETQALKEYDKNTASFLQSDKDCYWGYVYFRQVKDKTLPRGYFQKVNDQTIVLSFCLQSLNYFQSFVIITRLPFINLFGELCATIAPEYFETGDVLMETVVREINRWDPPTPGQVVHLPLMGVLFQVNFILERKISLFDSLLFLF